MTPTPVPRRGTVFQYLLQNRAVAILWQQRLSSNERAARRAFPLPANSSWPPCYWLMLAAGAMLIVSLSVGIRAWRLLDTQLDAVVVARYARSGLLISVVFGIVAALLLFWSAVTMLRLRAAATAAAAQARSRAQQDEARLAGIIGSAMEAIIVVDEAQFVVLFNPMAEKLFGRISGETLGTPLAALIPERYRTVHHDHVERFGQTGVTERQMGKQLRLFALRADGVEFPIEASISHTRDADGKLYTVMLRDITERVRVDDELRASREELQQLSRGIQAAREQEKTRIARELHDDLGQQLTALKMDVTILEDELQANTDRTLLLSHLRGMYGLLDTTVASVRRIAADLRPVMLDDLGLAPAVEWLINDFSNRYRIRVVAQIAAEAIDFRPDAGTAVFRIIQEGLTNVARHASASEVRLEIFRQERDCVVRIADNGQGAPHTASRPLNSFGLLGVRERVRLLGGEVRIDTAPGRGFRADRFITARACRDRSRRADMTRVLIVDDHAMVRDGLRHILQNADRFEVVGEAADGPGLIKLARECPASVVLLDLSLPGRNGLELIKQLKDEHPGLKILVLTMHAEEQYAKRAFTAGASGYLTKESATDELVAAVTKVAGGGVYVSHSMAERLARGLTTADKGLPHEQLSDREFEVFRRLVEGQTLSDIASDLSLSSKTISTYKMRILDKLQLQSDAALVRYAIGHKLFDSDI